MSFELPVKKVQSQVSPACFSHLTSLLMTLAGGKVVALLEGGYFLTSLAGKVITIRNIKRSAFPVNLINSNLNYLNV